MASLSEREATVVDTHFASSPPSQDARVVHTSEMATLFQTSTGRLSAHKTSDRRFPRHQELVFHSVGSVSTTLTCSHTLKFWDLRRHATPRETARLQGFPDWFRIPTSRYNRLFGNAVSVPCARFACSRVVGEEEEGVTMIDLCSGVGGFHVAANEACRKGVECVGYSEVDVAAVKSYALNFPSVPALGDATRVREWPRCDLLCAGFPCQPFSKSRSESEPHRNIDFFKVVTEAVRKSGATRIVFENVPQLQSNPRFEEMRGELEEMGFRVEWKVLNACEFGLPQVRRRLYVVGRRDGRDVRSLSDHVPLPTRTLGSILEV